MTLRDITENDYRACLDIYNHYVLNTTNTLEIEAHTEQSFFGRIESIRMDFPYIVCELDGKVVGYAYLHRFNERSGYRYTCDVSIYVDRDFLHRGIGRVLMKEIISRAEKCGFKDIISIVTGENEPSRKFHIAMGFEQIGVFKGIANKFDRDIDVVYLQKKIR